MSDHDQPMLIRAFPTLSLREADTEGVMTGLVVPYGVPTPITEPRGNGVVRYREQFVPGAFERAIRAPRRVPLNYGHSDHFGDRLGYAIAFRDTPAGLEGDFKIDPSRYAQALDALTTSHLGLSAGFYSVRPAAFTEREGQLVTRTSTVLLHVAAVTQPAYELAKVGSFRAGDLDLGDPTTADIDAEEKQRQDRELLAWFAQERDRWASITS